MTLAVTGGLLTGSAGWAEGPKAPAYTNPVSSSFSDTFPDPSLVRGKDGWWYGFSTGAPVLHKQGDYSFHTPVIARSRDLVTWEYVGDVFTDDNMPEWLPEDGDTAWWAPDIRYIDGTYHLYFTARVAPGFRTFIGLATAPTPAGPWTDSGAPLVKSSGSLHTASIDAAQFTDGDGRRYLYWGSYRETGIMAAELSRDGRRLISEPRTVVATGEAPQVVRHGDHYYMVFSDSTCCAGVNSGYTVSVGRADNPLGPFVDREGVPLADRRYGGTTVLTANGNSWIGPGHQAIATDLAGQDWLMYHAIDKNRPTMDPPIQNLLRRPMMADRLDWIDGWPVVRAGAGASETSQPGPVTTPAVGGGFHGSAPLDEDWRREGAAGDGWARATEEQSGGYVRQAAPAAQPAFLVSRDSAPADVRAEADLRLAALPETDDARVGLTTGYQDADNHLVAWLDAGRNALVTDVRVDGVSAGERVTPLPDGFALDEWHNVAIEVRDDTMTVEVTDARLDDPQAVQTRTLSSGVDSAGSVGVASVAGRAEADNVVATELYQPVTRSVAGPEVGTVDGGYSDEFGDGQLDPAWSWVRDPAGEEVDSGYRWPTQDADLRPNNATASLLLRDAPAGGYTVETRMTLPLRPESSTGRHEAGLVAYADDNRHVRVTSTQTAPLYAAPSDIRLAHVFFSRQEGNGFGWLPAGATTDTIWLRLSHRVDPDNGEHDFRAAISRDGKAWTWGGVWTLPADTDVRIGLLSMGGAGTTAEFDHFRVHRP